MHQKAGGVMLQTKQMTSGLYQTGGGTCVRAAYETNVKASISEPNASELRCFKIFLGFSLTAFLGLKC